MKIKNILAKHICFENSRMYFSKAAERTVFFILTLAMLLVGIIAKLEIF